MPGFGLTLLAAVSWCASQGEPVTGRVSDPSNAPIAGATVTLQMISKPLETFTTKSDKDGIYEFREVPDGSYSIEASMKGHVSVRYFPIQIRFPFGFERDFRLPADEVFESDAPDKAHVAGELKVADKPVGGARICLRRRQEEFCATTNRLGQYSVLVPPGYWLAVVTSQKDKEVIWRQRLQFAKPGEYRDQIQIRIVAQAPPEEDGRPRGGPGRFRAKQK